MLAFKPRQDPILTKIAKSGLFQFIMVTILGVGVTWFVIRTDRPQQWIQKINRFSSVTLNPADINAQTTEAGIAEDSAEFEAPPAAASSWAARSMDVSASQTTATTTQTTVGTSAALSVSTTIRMLEVDNEYISTLMRQSHAANAVLQDDETKIFTVSPATLISPVQVLNSSNMRAVLNEVSRENYGNSSRGFTVTLSLTSVNADLYFFRFTMQPSMQPSMQPGDLSAPLEFNLRKGEKLIIAGNPLLRIFEFENELSNVAPFKIIKSADYKNQKTTLAIVVELK